MGKKEKRKNYVRNKCVGKGMLRWKRILWYSIKCEIKEEIVEYYKEKFCMMQPLQGIETIEKITLKKNNKPRPKNNLKTSSRQVNFYDQENE